jgi:hypothetical protein
MKNFCFGITHYFMLYSLHTIRMINLFISVTFDVLACHFFYAMILLVMQKLKDSLSITYRNRQFKIFYIFIMKNGSFISIETVKP